MSLKFRKKLRDRLHLAETHTHLTLSNFHLRDVPDEVWKLNHLRSLSLDGNRLERISPLIGNLQKLRILELHTNRLSDLPQEIRLLEGLEILVLHHNHFTTLPSVIFDLPRLTILAASGARLTSIGPGIGNLIHLRELRLNGNQLKTLPKEIGQLSSLQILQCRSNELKAIPDEIGELVNLRNLDLTRNALSELPDSVGNLAQLQMLDLSANPLTTLPSALGQCTKLRKLVLDSVRSLRFPPADIVELGANAVLRYLVAVHSSSEVVWESKVLLVGEGAVGKTWLYEALNGRIAGGNRGDDGATVGVEIGSLDLPHPQLSELMRLNCWDFAGQDINHATHQFFFSERSLFVLCWNARAGWEAGKLRKWLTNIRDRAPRASVLLVATHSDEPHSDYPEKELRAEFEQICAVFKVSSKTGDGIHDLKLAIAHHAAQLPMMGLQWPKLWRAAQQAVKELRSEAPYASFMTVLETVRSQGLQSEDAAVLLRWLHELGEVLHYAEVPELTNLVMLDPQWVTLHVGKVLANAEVQRAKGILTQSSLEQIWPQLDDHVRQHLLGMMERFDLAYRIPEDSEHRCLVVERLPQNPPEYERRWQQIAQEAQVRLRYRLKSLHPGIPTWFIARCHRFTLGLHWLRGVLFGDSRNNPRHLALITANETERTVDFIVRGPQPWTFLPLLTDGFEDTISKRYPGLEFERIAPCTGKKKDGADCDYEFNIKDLEALRWPKEREIESHNDITCLRCRTKHEIDKLLLGLSRSSARDESKLDEILNLVRVEARKTREIISSEMIEARAFIQLSFVQEWNSAQEFEEQSCPTVFALYPLNDPKLTRKSTLYLQLYCMNAGGWHSIGRDGGCEIEAFKPGFITLVNWAGRAARWLKPVSALLPSGSQVAADYSESLKTFAKHAENELKLTADLFKQFTDFDELSDIDIPVEDVGFYPRERGQKINLYELKSLLDSLPFPIKPYGGLRRVRTPEGHILWLCENHVHELRSSFIGVR